MSTHRAGRPDDARSATARRAATMLASALACVIACSACAPRRASRTAGADVATSAAPAPADAGLGVVRWYVPADPAARRRGLDELLTAGAARTCPTPLAAQGVLAFRTSVDRLPEVASALGGAGAGSRRLALGQSTAFADLLSVPIARDTPVLAEGRPERTSESLLRLEARGWCFPTVESAAARLELRMVEDEMRFTAIAMDPSRVRPPSREVRKGSVALELAPGEALLLVDAPVVPPEKDSADPLAALPPPSRAALLFGASPIPDRVAVLVIIPAFGDMLPPVAPAPTAGASSPSVQSTSDPSPADPSASDHSTPPHAEASPDRDPEDGSAMSPGTPKG